LYAAPLSTFDVAGTTGHKKMAPYKISSKEMKMRAQDFHSPPFEGLIKRLF
jgi:hypothetical protein